VKQGCKCVYLMVNIMTSPLYKLPDGKYYDITSLQMMENKLIGHRESHRLVFTVKAETWNMGKVLKKIG